MKSVVVTRILWIGCLVAVVCGRGLVALAEDAPKPAAKSERPWVLYLLPHSHVDIGYTHVQTDVERRQWQNIEEAMELCRRTADYPPEARFKWNMEVLWAVESYLKQASPEKRAAFIEAVKRGQIGLDGLFGNELTGLCRPEELMHLTDYARRLAREHGVAIDSAMISDVPGYTWGLVPAMAQNGIKYFSIGPNHCHRIGLTLERVGRSAVLLGVAVGRRAGAVLGGGQGVLVVPRRADRHAGEGRTGADPRVPRRTGRGELPLRHGAAPLQHRRRQRPARPDHARLREEVERRARIRRRW